MKIVHLILLVGGSILFCFFIRLLVQTASYKLRIRKSGLLTCICIVFLAVADIITGISALGGFNHG